MIWIIWMNDWLKDFQRFSTIRIIINLKSVPLIRFYEKKIQKLRKWLSNRKTTMCGLKKDAILLVIDNGSLIILTWRHTHRIVDRDRWCSTKRVLHHDQNRNCLLVIWVQMVHFLERYEDSPRPIVDKWNHFWWQIDDFLLCTDILQHFQWNNLSNWFKNKGQKDRPFWTLSSAIFGSLKLMKYSFWEFDKNHDFRKFTFFNESDNFLINSWLTL